jgi:hypothetical protein
MKYDVRFSDDGVETVEADSRGAALTAVSHHRPRALPGGKR